MMTLQRKLAAEMLGTALLLATVVGSGIMAERLADGNTAIALLGNTIATGAILVVLITALAPVSGAHFNPAVTLVFLIRKEIPAPAALLFVLAQITGGISGVFLAHGMFEEAVFQTSANSRTGTGQWLSEAVATFGLIFTILTAIRWSPHSVAWMVGLYITAAYWFTASTSFANPAVTLARSLTDTFSGIHPWDAPMFILAQVIGVLVAAILCHWLLQKQESRG